MSPTNAGAKTFATNYSESDADVDGTQAEAELHKMQRQLRALENERRTYSEEARSILVRQNVAVEKLRQDNESLKHDLKLLKHQVTDDKKSGAGSKKAEILKDDAEQCQHKIKEALHETASLDKQILEIQRLSSKYRAKLGGTDVTASQSALQKHIVGLESRLNKNLIRFNKALEKNQKLRDTIDVLRRDRSAFQTSYHKFEKEMAERKKHMSAIIQSSTAAYESRDEAQARMVALKDRADKEHQNFVQEVKELERQYEQDRRLRSFLNLKNAERIDNAARLEAAAKNQSAIKGSQELFSEKLESYQKGFEQLRQVTKCPDIPSLVAAYTKMEDANFSLFNYTNDTHSRVEALNVEIADLQRELADVENDEQDYVLMATFSTIKDADSKMTAAQTGVSQLTVKNTQNERSLSRVVDSIQEYVTILDIQGSHKITAEDEPSKLSFIVENPQVVLDNLCVVEEKTNELLMKNMLISLPKRFTTATLAHQANIKVEDKDDGKSSSNKDAGDAGTSPALLAQMLKELVSNSEKGDDEYALKNIANILGKGPAAKVSSPTLIIPATEDDSDTHDDTKPMTRVELTNRLILIQKMKEQAAIQAALNAAREKEELAAAANEGTMRRLNGKAGNRRATVSSRHQPVF